MWSAGVCMVLVKSLKAIDNGEFENSQFFFPGDAT